MHCLKACFEKVMGALRMVTGGELTAAGNLIRPGPKPRFSDLEVLCLSLTAEILGIDSENDLFARLQSDYQKQFPNLVSRRQYNDRRKLLHLYLGVLRDRMASQVNKSVRVFIIDSMPLDTCKVSRERRARMGKENPDTAPDKGYCASQNRYYFGYKLHSVCSEAGVIQAVQMTKASVHDIHYLQEIKHQFRNCTIIGDKGYINRHVQAELERSHGITLEVPPRANQRGAPMSYKKRSLRKRIETVFSQLCDQFNIRDNYAKSYVGFRTRILAKVAGMTILQYRNKFVTDKSVSQLKQALF